ncbi:MAG TPA: hypothetical protein VGL89_15625 [Candidatus Koribacter sp.]|jgi:hypothetical protein
MRTCRKFVFLAGLLCCLAAAAQSRPNFTGIWKLDAQRSNMPSSSANSVVLYIHQNDPDFHVRRTETQHGKSTAWSAHGHTDGTMVEMKSHDGVKRTHMYWQGSELVLEVKSDGHRGASHTVMRYQLADDGHTLIAQEDDNNHQIKWVFTKSG